MERSVAIHWECMLRLSTDGGLFSKGLETACPTASSIRPGTQRGSGSLCGADLFFVRVSARAFYDCITVPLTSLVRNTPLLLLLPPFLSFIPSCQWVPLHDPH